MDDDHSKAAETLPNTNSIMVLLVSVVLAACSGTPVGTEDAPDEFAAAALSWEGSHIREMIAVWGWPNDAYVESARFSDGYGRWKDDATESGCIDAYPVRQTRVCQDAQRRRCEIIDKNERSRNICERKHRTSRNAQQQRCIITATFDAAGTITEIDVFSRRCSKVYAENIPFLTK
jgi:hypothetical protein